MSKAVSSKSISFYDWEMTFKRKLNHKFKHDENKKVNSLGLSDETFKDFIKKWKEKNLT